MAGNVLIHIEIFMHKPGIFEMAVSHLALKITITSWEEQATLVVKHEFDS